MKRLRGEVYPPLTRHEYDALYWRALTGSRKEAATAAGINETAEKHALTAAFRKLKVSDITEAFRALGWLRPTPWYARSDITDTDPRPYVPWPHEETQ